MLMKRIFYWLALLTVLTMNGCSDDDLGPVETASVLRFEFPQGNDVWDREFERIAKDWGMYVIYKDIDSLALNRSWTTPVNASMAYKGDAVAEENIPVYLDLIKTTMLSSLDKTKESNRKMLPVYLLLLNNFRSSSGQTMQINMKGFDYWVLSLTDEELASGLSTVAKHKIACTFGYLPIASELDEGVLKASEQFLETTDYNTPIGVAYNMGSPFFDSQDPVNLYLRRGFLPQTSEDFELEAPQGDPSTYAPSWMPWISGAVFSPDFSRNYQYEQDVNVRYAKDFVNYIRYAMMYTEEEIRTMYPLDGGDPIEQRGNALIQKKYDMVIGYMKSKGHDLAGFADILKESAD